MSSNEADHNRESGRSAGVLDPVSYRILDLLRENGRISIAALADKVDISRANAYTRVESLVSAGVITGFSARVDPARQVDFRRCQRIPSNVYGAAEHIDIVDLDGSHWRGP